MYDLQDSLIELNVQCSTVYTTPIYITLIDRNGFVNQTIISYTCSNGRFEIMPSGDCNRDIQLCGYFTFENGSVVMDGPLNCSNSVVVPCPTSPPLTTQPGPSRKYRLFTLSVSSLLVLLFNSVSRYYCWNCSWCHSGINSYSCHCDTGV